MKKLTIATHNGKFHIDEVMSIAILKIIYPNCEILRIRDEKEIKKAEIRVDIGKKYNPRTNDFDHHQINSPIRKNKIPYSSCGLIWGERLCASSSEIEGIDYDLLERAHLLDHLDQWRNACICCLQ
ncbi:MAG: MYG1 family protein [Nanoarchaeota archaeon]